MLMSFYDVLYMAQTLRQEKRMKSMGTAVPGLTHTILLLGGGECEPLHCVAAYCVYCMYVCVLLLYFRTFYRVIT